MIQCVDSNDSMISVCGSAGSIQSNPCSVRWFCVHPKSGTLQCYFVSVLRCGPCFRHACICACGGNFCGCTSLAVVSPRVLFVRVVVMSVVYMVCCIFRLKVRVCTRVLLFVMLLFKFSVGHNKSCFVKHAQRCLQ